MEKTSIHGMWSSRFAFILAATGSAVGLGNIWRFPYMTSDNGGGAFVLVYLLCVAMVALPILFAEIAIGRRGRRSPIHSLMDITREDGVSRGWVGIGWISIIAGVLILSFYSVVAGWTLHYSWLYVKQLFGGAAITDPGLVFAELLSHPFELTFWHAVFMVLTMGVVALGVEQGLERAVKFLMPALFIMLLLLVAYGATTGHLGAAASFLFNPDWSKIDGGVFLRAMGQAFFSLSLGMCTMMTYGAYLPRDVSVPRVGATVALADTGIALLAGLAIFPIVIGFGMAPTGGGAGLIFTSLPLAFNSIPFGVVYGLIFFLLLAFAAWTSSISLLEPATAFLVERGVSRKTAALSMAAFCWGLGLLSVLGFNHWSHVKILGRDIMSFIELIANDLMLPLGGLLIALFAGWFISGERMREQLHGLPAPLFTLWRWLVRVVAPVLVAVVLVRAVI
ncbi:sodium-dependent transporter [Rehaibacterium terrae]|jgi:NSS family neurotransmitter:Na+ symporter|uniref:Transporter n=1 Tax=Rehaibacterium terrae TaxID=1341696 RepID=A0A7W7XX25_9GAMM|nr:sodium-dependent transporter [Rehaibacterium terrae]MBB5014288.1 NSS family neurotransmitter:Na+ symporter [Rehaibacterium terrae]